VHRAKSFHGGAIAQAIQAKQILSLFLQLFDRWTRGKARCGIGHYDLLSVGPRPHAGLKEDRKPTKLSCSVGSALSRGLEAPFALVPNVMLD
jgi:hypothetical protein